MEMVVRDVKNDRAEIFAVGRNGPHMTPCLFGIMGVAQRSADLGLLQMAVYQTDKLCVKQQLACS
jgi:hypothetical protein